LNSEQYAKLLEAATSQAPASRFSKLDAVLAKVRPMKQELHEIHIKHATCDGGALYTTTHLASQTKWMSLIHIVSGSSIATGAPRAADAPPA
jgi:hypothetical protein